MAEADTIARTRRARFATSDALFADLEKNRRKVSARRRHGRSTTPNRS